MTRSARAAGRSLALALMVAAAGALPACTCDRPPTEVRVDPPPSTASAEPTADAAAVAPAPPPPTLSREELVLDGVRPSGIYAIEGALIVSEGARVGRVVGDKVEWIGTVPDRPQLGGTVVSWVAGRWPDAVDALYVTKEGRAPEPSYVALTGKGERTTFGEGGGSAWIEAVMRVGESVLVVGWSFMGGAAMQTVRGPKLVRKPTSAKQAGCTAAEVHRPDYAAEPAAIPMRAVAATEAGSILWVGQMCTKRALAAEIWDAEGKARIVDLGGLTRGGDSSDLVPGRGDEMWIITRSGKDVLRYHAGEVVAVPWHGHPIRVATTDADRRLHIDDGRGIFRRDADRWIEVARFAWPQDVRSLVVHEGSFYGATWTAAYRFRAGPSVELTDTCATPFVYLYDVGASNARDYTFPTTRKALASFPEASSLELVEVNEDGARRLGVKTASPAQAKAVVAHVQATMKDEEPRAMCYAPRQPRTIPLEREKK